jgi:serine/threonine protein kinase
MRSMPLPIPSDSSAPEPRPRIDWESFYQHFRKPGYVPGFEIVNKLGGGVFGQVYKARKESIGKDYAIKFLKVDDESVRDAVRRELDAVRHFAQLDHPNLVSIEDLGEVDGIPYLVMSYAGQETLRSRLEQGRMTRDDAMRIFVQAARGVQALHERSLVHFDIKPANIFLKGDIARVGDFGLSKLVTESRNSLSFGRGTPYYMAPEMLQRRGDSKSDIYSLGVVLYECLCGRVPFSGDSEWEVLQKHEKERPQFPDSIADADRRVVERCMQKDPAMRFASVADLLRELDAPVSLGESVLLPRAIGTSPLASSPANQNGPVVPGAAVLVPPPLRNPSLGDSSGPLDRDPADSPYGMSWRDGVEARGVLAWFVRGFLSLSEGITWLVLVPVKLLSGAAGRGALWVLKLPFRIIGFAAQLIGYLVVAALVLLVLVAILAVFGAM